MNEYQLSREDIVFLTRLREKGCAVCVFLPQEMELIADPDSIEIAMTSAGWDRIYFEQSQHDAVTAEEGNA